MKALKIMLLGFAFLLIALMGVILYESDFGYILFLVGAPIGLLLCIVGCFREELRALLAKAAKDDERGQGNGES